MTGTRASLTGVTDRSAYVRWAWQIRLFAARVTSTSFAFTLIIVIALAIGHQAIYDSANETLRILGYSLPGGELSRFASPVPLFAAAVVTWGVLLSFSQLVVARQVRNYLRGVSSVEIKSKPELGGRVDLVVERMLIETHLAVLSTVARVFALSVVLLLLLRLTVLPGLVVGILIVSLIGAQRFRQGAFMQASFRDASREHRLQPSQTASDEFIEAIYFRDSYLHRLPFLPLLAILATGLLVAGLPALLGSNSQNLGSLLISLVWIQSVIRVATESGALGWRWSHRESVVSGVSVAEADEV